MTATVTPEDISCYGFEDGSISFTNPSGGSETNYNFSIDGGVTFNPATAYTGLVPDTLQVYIQDAGVPTCTKYLGEFIIREPLPLTATVDWEHISCYQANDGQIILKDPQNYQGGSYQFLIRNIINGDTDTGNGTFANLGPGFFEITMRDVNGCELVLDTVEIIEPLPLTATVDFTNTTCLGNDGTITVFNPQNSMSGIYEYRISGHAWQANNLFEGLSADTFVVYIRDAALISCEQTIDTIIITEQEPLYAEAETIDITCYDGSNGFINVTLEEGGSGVYDYSLEGVADWQRSTEFSGLIAGNYTLVMRDAQAIQCQYTVGDFTINEPDPLYAEAVPTPVSCFGYTDGVISIPNPQGGSGGYEYSLNGTDWIKGDFTDLPAGNYTITMRDTADFDCTFTLAEAVVDQPEEITAALTPTDVTCYDGEDGTVTI